MHLHLDPGPSSLLEPLLMACCKLWAARLSSSLWGVLPGPGTTPHTPILRRTYPLRQPIFPHHFCPTITLGLEEMGWFSPQFYCWQHFRTHFPRFLTELTIRVLLTEFFAGGEDDNEIMN